MTWLFSTACRVRQRGISLVEILIASALILLMFGGIIAGFRSALVLVGNGRASSGAIGLANQSIEYIRSLPYDDVGTALGIPSGSIPQTETVVLNNVSYTRRILIQYVDAPEDGLAAADTNGITTDYKHAKVELTWSTRGVSKSISLVTNIIPKNIETVSGGGTLVVNVFDATAAPVSNATVRIRNTSTSSPVDVTSYSNPLGVVMFPGTPASGGYQISATKDGYSLDQTYSASSSNPNPNPAHVSIIAGNVSTVNFAIDRVSTRIVRTVEPPIAASTTDLLNDTLGIVSSSTVVVGAGEIVLQGAPGTYSSLGGASSTVIAPSELSSWTQLSWSGSVPVQTNLSLHVYSVDAGGVYTQIPDIDLPGNAVGFATSPVSLSGLSIATYPRIAIGTVLESFDGSDTSHLQDWSVSYMIANTPVPNASVTLTGTKNIGTDASSQPVKKYSRTNTTDASGVVTVSDLEWDQYTATVSGSYDISDICAASSLLVAPNSFATTTLVLSAHTTHSLLVGVFTTSGNPIGGATVQIKSGGAPISKTTSSCGYAYFGGLSSVNYDATTTASGYTTDTLTGVVVNGTTKLNIVLSP